MLKTIRTATVAALIGLGAFAAAPATAQAGDFYLGIGGGHSRSGVELHFGDRDYRRHHWDRHDHWERPRLCTPGRALRKAERMGIHRAYIRDVGRRYIRVGGRSHGERVRVTFARAPHCPVVRWH